MKELKSVITGDVINSSVEFKNEQKLLLKNLNNIYKKVQSFYPQQLPYEIDIFRGDSFQFFIDGIVDSVKILMTFWLYAKSQGVAMKLSMGIGTVDFLKKTNISESNGEAFLLSGSGLEKIDGKSFIKIETPNLEFNHYANAYTELLDLYLKNYSEKNALAVFGKIVGLTQENIAELWGREVSRQSVSKHWKTVQVDKLIKSIEKFSKSLYDISYSATL